MSEAITREKRSWIMGQVRSINTKPEILVRSLTHKLGYRFRLHRSDLPGKPDIAFPSRHKIIFVHGCFWHGHNCSRGARSPKSNIEYWRKKINGNKERDKKSLTMLKKLGWKTIVIWECQTRDREKLESRIKKFLS